MLTQCEIRLARPAEAQEIAVLSRDRIEQGLAWSWTPARVLRSIRDRATNVAVVRDDRGVVAFAIMRYDDEQGHLDLFARLRPALARTRAFVVLGLIFCGYLIIHAGRVHPYYLDYYGEHGVYWAVCSDAEILTSIVTRAEWLDLACSLDGAQDRLTLADEIVGDARMDDVEASAAVWRLAESVALGVRFANLPLYRLLSADIGPQRVHGRSPTEPPIDCGLMSTLSKR